MIIANVRVNLSSAETLSCASIPKNAVGLKVRFQYADPLWNKLSKTAVFRNGTRTVNSVLNEDCAVIPHELLSKTKDTIYVGLYGTDSNRNLAIPTVWAKLGEVSSAANPSTSVTAEATLPYWAQIQEKVDFLEEEMMLQEDLERVLLQAKESGAFDGPQGPMGEQGDRGEIGPAGYTPILGTDYWTAEDKNTITAEAANVAASLIQNSSDIICTATGSMLNLNDASNRELHDLKLYGKTIQNGIPAPEAPLELETTADRGTITVKIGTSGTDVNPQILTAQTPNGLPGIPVSSGGNYTDDNGQMWICDEIDFARGKYVQRVLSFALADLYIILDAESEDSTRFKFGVSEEYKGGIGLCSHVPRTDWGDTPNTIGFGPITSRNRTTAYIQISGEYDVDTVKDLFRKNDWVAMVALEVPTETDLPEEEIAQYSALHTNYPNTTILNDEGAIMEVKYVADTKLYIDRRINELSTTV